MPDDDFLQISETALPGIGLRDDFLTETGRRVGVIAHHGGRRELLIYGKSDPDACTDNLVLTQSEADALAELLGTRRIIERLSSLSEQVETLRTQKIPVHPGSQFDGATLGDTQVRSRTGASIVAVLRNHEAIASPTPDFQIKGGDQLIVVGTSEALSQVSKIINEG